MPYIFLIKARSCSTPSSPSPCHCPSPPHLCFSHMGLSLTQPGIYPLFLQSGICVAPLLFLVFATTLPLGHLPQATLLNALISSSASLLSLPWFSSMSSLALMLLSCVLAEPHPTCSPHRNMSSARFIHTGSEVQAQSLPRVSLP